MMMGFGNCNLLGGVWTVLLRYLYIRIYTCQLGNAWGIALHVVRIRRVNVLVYFAAG